MSDLYKNIVYDGAHIEAGGDIHIGDIVYNLAEDFHHTILFLRLTPLEGGRRVTTQIFVKSRHSLKGKLATTGEPLLQEEITLDLPDSLFQLADDYQQTRRQAEALWRKPGSGAAQAIRHQEEQLSRAMHDTFFSGEVGRVCRDFLNLLQKRKVKELLLVVSADGARLRNLPWEMVLPHLVDNVEDLGVSGFGIVRTTERSLAAFDMSGRTGSPAPLKLLFVTALPENLSERDKMLEIEDEQRKLIEAVGSLEATGSQPKILTEFLDNASLDEIKAALAARRHDILHVSGHGAYLAQVQQGVLFMEDEWGDELRIRGAELGAALQHHLSLKLIVLNACETGVCADQESKVGSSDSKRDLSAGVVAETPETPSGVAESLALASGVPAIVAMRYAVTDGGAKLFTSVLYERLAKGETLTQAFASARQALWQDAAERRQKEPDRPCAAEWFTPLLWLNQYVGALVEVGEYRLPEDFYPRSSFFKTHHSRLVGQGFIGRKRYLIRLRRLFTEGKHACLHGLGGMGKTTLAEAFAHNYDNRSHELLIFRGGAEINEKVILDRLLQRFWPAAVHVMEQVKACVDSDATPEEKLQALLDNCLAGRKCILLFDNFEDVQVAPNSSSATFPASAEQESGAPIASPALRSFLLYLCENAPSGCHLLFTTRYRIGELEQHLTHLSLDKMTYAEQYRLCNYSDHLHRIPMHLREGVWRRLDGHPRAYEFLESLLKKDPDFDWGALDASFVKLEARVFEDLLLEKIWQRLPLPEQNLFKLASVFIARTEPAALAAVSGQPEAALLPLLRSLQGWSVCFLEEDGGSFEVHRLTREWMMKNKVGEGEWKAWALKAGEFYEKQNHVDTFHLAIAYFEMAEAWEPFADASFRLQRFYEKQGFNQQVLELNRKVLEKNISPAWNAGALGNIGYLYLKTGDYDRALSNFEESLKIMQEIGDRAGEGTTLNNIAGISHAKGDYDTALRYYQQSLKIRQEIGDRKGEGATLNNIGQIHTAKGDYDTALRYLQQSLKIRQEIGDRAGEGATLNNISQIHQSKGDYDTALHYLQQSLKIAQEIGDRAGEGATLNNISQIHTAKGDNDTALHYLQQSLKIAQEIGDRAGEGVTLNNIGQIHYAKGDYDRALCYYQQSLKIRQEIGDRKGEGVTLNNIGQIHYAKGDYDTALGYYQQSLEIAQEIGDRAGEGVTLNNIGQIHYAKGDYDTALRYYQQSLKIRQEIGDIPGMAVTLHNMGALLFEEGKLEEAVPLLVQAYSINQKLGSPNARLSESYLNAIIWQIGEARYAQILQNLQNK